ncbi:MAG: hypothetical protein Q4F95_00690 [Oscillospiraceae bacterium]|nr:hypothetical protein [Oscillospiraceae bacterium]
MNWDEISNFTWGEIENFTWEDLKLDIKELLNKSKDSESTVPYSIILKLENLCKELDINEPTLADGLESRNMSVVTALSIISSIIMIADKLPDLYTKYKPIVVKLLEEISKLL